MDNTEHIIQELRSEKWEMAQEIERLREALSAIALSHNNTVPPEGLNAEMMWIGCVQIARSALQQKESE